MRHGPCSNRQLLQVLRFPSLVVVLGCSSAGRVTREGEVRWQLFNECSQGMLQSYLGHVNARGYPERYCLTDFHVSVNFYGAIQLQHAQSRKYICFNKRRRITLRLNGSSQRCFFHERINHSGYSELESAWQPKLFLGFNGRGRFQDPSTYFMERRCFHWLKYTRYVPEAELSHCERRRTTPKPVRLEHSNVVHSALRASLLSQVRASHDGPYRHEDSFENSTFP